MYILQPDESSHFIVVVEILIIYNSVFHWLVDDCISRPVLIAGESFLFPSRLARPEVGVRPYGDLQIIPSW
jgi:hypothetical protein